MPSAGNHRSRSRENVETLENEQSPDANILHLTTNMEDDDLKIKMLSFSKQISQDEQWNNLSHTAFRNHANLNTFGDPAQGAGMPAIHSSVETDGLYNPYFNEEHLAALKQRSKELNKQKQEILRSISSLKLSQLLQMETQPPVKIQTAVGGSPNRAAAERLRNRRMTNN